MSSYRQHPYWGATDLKNYLNATPKQALHNKMQPTEQSYALNFGFAFHRFIECKILGIKFDYSVVKPLENPKTGKPFGFDTEAQKRHLESFGECIFEDDFTRINKMFAVLFQDSDIKAILKNGNPEVELFSEETFTKGKLDAVTKKKIVDWKTIANEDFSPKRITLHIYKHGYNFAACHYQQLYFEQTGVWLPFVCVFVTKEEPYDCVIVDLTDFCVSIENDIAIVADTKVMYNKIIELHKECYLSQNWGGFKTLFSSGKVFNPRNQNNLKYA